MVGNQSPIAIGGVGGSGTRVVASALQQAGLFIGNDLNESLDNLYFTLLFKDRRLWQAKTKIFQERLTLFVAVMSGRNDAPGTPKDLIHGARPDSGAPQQDKEWLKRRLSLLSTELASPQKQARIQWGWKEPNTHILVDKLADQMPDFRYIHVIRNGLDMAFSSNQNQLHFWGRYFLDEITENIDPAITAANSLAYWVRAEKRIREIASKLENRILLVRYEDLCNDPHGQLQRLFSYAGLSVSEDHIDALAETINSPDSLGRGYLEDLSQFDPNDLDSLAGLGYGTNPLKDGDFSR